MSCAVSAWAQTDIKQRPPVTKRSGTTPQAASGPDCLQIIDSAPPGGSIDARQPHDINDAGARVGWQFIDVVLDNASGTATFENTEAQSIPDDDNDGVESTIMVPAGLIIEDVNIGLHIVHSWLGDLAVELRHGEDAVILVDQPGFPRLPFGSQRDGLDVVLDDEGRGGSIEDVPTAEGPPILSPPSYVPNQPLSIFDGQDAAGLWTLTVLDLQLDDVGTLVEWSLELTVSGVTPPLPEDFEIVEDLPTGQAPAVVDIVPIDETTFRVVLDQSLNPGVLTTLRFTCGGKGVTVGYLPADVDGNCQSGPLDILALIDGLNGVADPPLNAWQCDANRSGLCEPTDILRIIDLLNGAGAFDPWIGAQLPCGPCDTDADCDDGLFCNGVETCNTQSGQCAAGNDPCGDVSCGPKTPLCFEGDPGFCECPELPCFDFTLGLDALLGSRDDDEFCAQRDSKQMTLQSGDTANGLAGYDRLEAELASDGGQTVTPLEILDIEEVLISDLGASTTTLDAMDIAGWQTLQSVDSTVRTGVTNIQENLELGLENTSVGGTFAFDAAATDDPDDVLTLKLTDVAIAGATTIVPGSADGFEHADIWSQGVSNNLGNLVHDGSESLISLDVFGDAALVLRRTPSSVVHYDCSGMSAGGVSLGGGSGTQVDPFVALHATNSDIASIIGSPGPDRVIMGSTFDANDAADPAEFIDLGAGTDLFQATLSGTIGGILPVFNTEILGLNALAESQLNLTAVSGITEIVNYEDGSTQALFLLNVGATQSIFPDLVFRGDGQQAGQIYDAIRYQPAGASGVGDTVFVFVHNANNQPLNVFGATNAHVLGNLTIPSIENVVFDCQDGPCIIEGGLVASSLTNLTISSSSNVTLNTVATGDGDTILSINAASVSGGFTILTNDLASAATISAGPGDDAVTIGDSNATSSVVSLGTGADTYTSTDSDSQDVIACGAGNDTVTAGGGNDVVTLGAGEDQVIIDQNSTFNRSDVSDLTPGPGGDEVVFDISALGLAGGTEYIGAVAGVSPDSSEEIVVLTGTGYANDAQAASAVHAVVTTDGLDMVIIYYNTTTSTSHIILESNAGVGGTVVHIGTLTNFTTFEAQQALTADNIGSQP